MGTANIMVSAASSDCTGTNDNCKEHMHIEPLILERTKSVHTNQKVMSTDTGVNTNNLKYVKTVHDIKFCITLTIKRFHMGNVTHHRQSLIIDSIKAKGHVNWQNIVEFSTILYRY